MPIDCGNKALESNKLKFSGAVFDRNYEKNSFTPINPKKWKSAR